MYVDERVLLLIIVLAMVAGGSFTFSFISWVFGGKLDEDDHGL